MHQEVPTRKHQKVPTRKRKNGPSSKRQQVPTRKCKNCQQKSIFWTLKFKPRSLALIALALFFSSFFFFLLVFPYCKYFNFPLFYKSVVRSRDERNRSNKGWTNPREFVKFGQNRNHKRNLSFCVFFKANPPLLGKSEHFFFIFISSQFFKDVLLLSIFFPKT